MPDKFVIPQFIDVEDKILGPITTRQFLILLAVSLFVFIAYKIFYFTLFVIVGVSELAVGAILAFVKINGQPFHFFLLNLTQTSRRPKLRVWDKELTDAELKELLKAPPPPPPRARAKKEPLAATKLAELTLIVNTGGVYNPEE